LQIDAGGTEIDSSVAQALIDRDKEREESHRRQAQSENIPFENDWEDDFLLKLVPDKLRLTSSVLQGTYGEAEDFMDFSIE